MGASAVVLPSKSALCLACHTANLGLADWPSRIALGLLAIGLLGSLGFWLSGGDQGPTSSHGHGHGLRPGSMLASFFLDGLLQRRLWRISPARWLIHALIFLPMAARMAWALVALFLGRLDPSAPMIQAMLYKNAPVTALFFDLTGALVLAGVALAVSRRMLRSKNPLPGLPRPDYAAMGLLAGIVLSGFITEGARMAMTGAGAATPYAFLGAALSGLFSAGPGLQEAYGYIWYAHAICYAAFVAYLPFSRMRHILLAPLWLALGSGSGRDKDLD
jgi:nitrate reductase gamma subunit